MEHRFKQVDQAGRDRVISLWVNNDADCRECKQFKDDDGGEE